jgi:type I restriction enzyme S subunit
MNINFIRFFFETIIARNLSISLGTAIPNLSTKQINETAIPLPPLAEQHRIVAKVDELMALCDQLEQARAGREAVRDRLTTASLARLTAPDNDAETFQPHARFALQFLPTLTTRPDQIKTLRQTILNLAVRGKLVAQDAADEAATHPPIKSSSGASGWDKKVFTEFSQNFDLPLGWQIAPMACLSEHIVDCPHTTPKWTEQGEICVRTNQLRAGSLDLSKPRFVSLETYNERIERLQPMAGDIL